jgi:hypothetical protein
VWLWHSKVGAAEPIAIAIRTAADGTPREERPREEFREEFSRD